MRTKCSRVMIGECRSNKKNDFFKSVRVNFGFFTVYLNMNAGLQIPYPVLSIWNALYIWWEYQVWKRNKDQNNNGERKLQANVFCGPMNAELRQNWIK